MKIMKTVAQLLQDFRRNTEKKDLREAERSAEQRAYIQKILGHHI